ncbi:MAG: M14 family metallopeptidase [Hyphomicrobiales bacterium]
MSYKDIIKICFSLFFTFSFIVSEGQTSISWLTKYEKSGGTETPSYKETIEFCKRLSRNSSLVKYTSFGYSGEGNELPLLIIDKNKNFSPESVKESGNAVLLIQACIHSGEPDGKDAGLALIRDMVIEEKKIDLLNNVTILFIPILNVDGHQLSNKYNRINQNGPTEMGWRANATNLNLNRDYLKSESPEIIAWHHLYNNWEPDFFIDCHTTDGADYQYVATYAMETFGNMSEDITKWQKNKFIPFLERKMKQSSQPIFPYVSFRNWHDPRSGLYSKASSSMISQGYTALTNRPGLLIETHMLKSYRTRVEATYNMLMYTLSYLNNNSKKLQRILEKEDLRIKELSENRTTVPLSFSLDMNDSTKVSFKGIDYDVKKSDITNGDWFTYHPEEDKTFKIYYFNTNIPEHLTTVPYAYIIPPQWKDVKEKLDIHGVEYYILDKESKVEVLSYNINNPKWSNKPFEGKIKLTYDVDTISRKLIYPKGSYIIYGDQQKIKVAMHLLEPYSDNSLLSWGYFNSVFEQKEYGESYVMEPILRKMLNDNPKIKAEYESKKKKDPDFANSPWKQINWFYMQTSYGKQNIKLYPIGKIMDKSVLQKLKEFTVSH